MIDRATLEAEKADYERQLAQAQQEAAGWQQRALLASGALQATNALLAKLPDPTTEADPAS